MADFNFDPQSLDLTNLREITGGDTELEVALFTTYLESSKHNIDTLATICADGDQKEWKELSHSLKGESANLGAVKLTAICQDSQMAFAASRTDKQALLDQIKAEWEIVRGYLEQMLAA